MSITSSKIILVMLALLLIACLLPFTVDPKYDRKSSQVATILSDADTITDLAAGTSHGMAFNFQEMNLSGVNMYNISANSREVLKNYRRTEAYLPNLKRVWLGISPATFYNNLSRAEPIEGYLPNCGIVCLHIVDWQKRFSVFWRKPKEIFRAKMGFRAPRSEFETSERGLPIRFSHLELDQIPQTVDKTLELYLKYTSLESASDPYVKLLVEHALSKKIDVMFVITPMTDAHFHDPRQAEFVIGMYEILKTLEAAYSNVMIIDAHDWFSPQTEDSVRLFFDDNHLNYEGSKALALLLKEKLNPYETGDK